VPVEFSGIAVLLLAVLFGWASLAKLVRLSQWRAALRAYRLPHRGLIAPLTPVVEAVVPVLVVSGRSRAAVALALVLLAVFSLVLLRARAARGNRLPCGCFGRATERDYRLMLLRNTGLGVLAAIVLAAGHDVRALEGIGTPDASEVVPAALAFVGLVALAGLARALASTLRGGQP
jgi:uncharacterized membrane protein YphA (DoxX/SURF4 family)